MHYIISKLRGKDNASVRGRDQQFLFLRSGDCAAQLGIVAGDCHLANTAIVEQTGQVAQHPLQVMARAYGIAEESSK